VLQSRYTIGEDSADAGGLSQSFTAWKNQFDSDPDGTKSPNFLLPGLNYTREQLFFIAYARGWVRGIKPAEAVRRIRVDPRVFLSRHQVSLIMLACRLSDVSLACTTASCFLC
jgi:predicted metalloendopeptidase